MGVPLSLTARHTARSGGLRHARPGRARVGRGGIDARFSGRAAQRSAVGTTVGGGGFARSAVAKAYPRARSREI